MGFGPRLAPSPTGVVAFASLCLRGGEFLRRQDVGATVDEARERVVDDRAGAHGPRDATAVCASASLAARGEMPCTADLELTSDDVDEADPAAATITVQGARYPAHLEKRVGR